MLDPLLGSARFIKQNLCTPSHLEQRPMVGFGTIEHEGQKLYCSSFVKRHFITVASTRGGKGVSLIVPTLLRYGGSCIVIDPKGENAWITAKHRREMGQKTIILDPWGEVNRRYGDLVGEKEEIATFNPLSILDPASEHYADDVAYIADALIINEGKDPHWDNSARELVAGLISFCVESFGKAASLPMVRLLLSKPLEDISGIAAEAQKFGPESISARKLGRFVVESKEIGSIVSTALTQTAFLDSATLAKNLSESSFSFEDLINGFATIYLVLPVDKLYTYGRWFRLMVSLGIRTVARNTTLLAGPVLFLLDEFGTIGKLSAVAQAFGLMAGLQLCLWAFVQDLNQLKRDYPDEWETFIANCETLMAFDVMDQFTAKYLSEMLGTTTVERISQETASIREGGFLRRAEPEFTKMADQVFARDLMQPNEVRQSEKCIIISRLGNSLIDLVPYYKDLSLVIRARPLPFYPLSDEQKAAIQKIEAEKLNAAREDTFKKCFSRCVEIIPNFEAAFLWFSVYANRFCKKGGLITAKYDIDGVGEGLSKDEVIEAARREVATRSRGLKDLLEQFKTDMEKIISAQAQG